MLKTLVQPSHRLLKSLLLVVAFLAIQIVVLPATQTFAQVPQNKCGLNSFTVFKAADKGVSFYGYNPFTLTGNYRYTKVSEAGGQVTYKREQERSYWSGTTKYEDVGREYCTKSTVCPGDSSPALRYGWTALYDNMWNGRRLAIAKIKIQTRVCVAPGGLIVGLAANHEDVDSFEVYPLTNGWNTNPVNIDPQCGYVPNSVTCTGSVNVSSRFTPSGSVSFTGTVNNVLRGALNSLGISISGGGTMTARTYTAPVQVTFRRNQYSSPQLGTGWYDVAP